MSYVVPQGKSGAAVWLSLGVVIGSIGSAFLGMSWISSDSEARIHVLGAGRQLSVLVEHRRRSVLFVAGTNSSPFNNALNQARPPLADPIDVILIDAGASEELVERAREIGAKQLFRLPGSGAEPDAETVQRSFQIDLGQRLYVEVRLSGDAWIASLQTPAGELLVTPGKSTTAHSAITISLDGSALIGPNTESKVGIGPAGGDRSPSTTIALVRPGEVLTIGVDAQGFRIDQDEFARS
jgi:hypothetical protein